MKHAEGGPSRDAGAQDVQDLAWIVETIYDRLLGEIVDLPLDDHKRVRAILERINPEPPR